MNEFNKKALELGEDRVLALVEIGILMRKAIEKGATENSCRTFLANELGFDKTELTQATLLARFPLATYSGCTSIKEAKQAFEVAKEEAKLEQDKQKEEVRKAQMTAYELDSEAKDTAEAIERTKANALNAKPNKVAGLQVRRNET